jgi:hypothetical protein
MMYLKTGLIGLALALTTIFCHREANTKPDNQNMISLSGKNDVLQLMRKEIYVRNSRILFDEEITQESLLKDWTIHHSEWYAEDGWLYGRNRGNHPGMAILKKSFPGNTLVEFEASTVNPSTHDINVMWNGEWLDSADQRGVAYVAGLQGWWTGKVGIERSPDYRFMVGTPLLDFQPGKIYKIQAGSIEGHCFIFADGHLLLEATDPDPIDNQKYTKVGLEAYSSWIRVRKLVIREINWKPINMNYEPEF